MGKTDMIAKTLAAVIICEYLVLASAYAVMGDWRRSAYWLLAAGITATVTF